MNINNTSLIKLKPKVAILDDDKDLISDMITCVNEIDLMGFSSPETIEQCISTTYNRFLDTLNTFFFYLNKSNLPKTEINDVFLNLFEFRPFSVALIDLNLNSIHTNEGFEICELLRPYKVKTLIYSGIPFNNFSLELINQEMIAGYLNKSDDLFENILPSIFSLNQAFLDYHYNHTHLCALKGILPSNFNQNNIVNVLTNSAENYIVYDEFLNFLTLN